MIYVLTGRYSRARAALVLLLACGLLLPSVHANPGGPVVSQGSASFSSQGSQFAIQTSDRAVINWQSFNIGVGQTTTFLQPSASSVVWNRINDPNPSQILGTLNANGYVVLQNQAGFYVGGQAVLNTHGLLMTTAPTPALDLAGGGAWQFNAPPPTASIINYGQINVAGGSSAFLIAHDIENHGTISAPQGSIGLYAGQQILMSERPDGRGLSAAVTLPEGSVNNSGQLIADAGTIAMHAQVVNQGGLVQANSVVNHNGVIELVASQSLELGAASVLSAQGDATATSPSSGGFVVVKSDGAFADTSTSTSNVSGQAGGRNGVVEVFGSGVTRATVQSQIDNGSAANFSAAGGLLLVNPGNLTLSLNASTPSAANPTLNLSDLSAYSRISLFAGGNITLNTSWILNNSDADAGLTLSAGNNITLANNSAIVAGNNWSVGLSAGAALAAGSLPSSANDSIVLNGNSYLQTRNGDLDLFAPNRVTVNSGAIRTTQGGSINVNTLYGDVNSGVNTYGFVYNFASAPSAPYYYSVSLNLGGISTAVGGDVTINAGGNVISYLPIISPSPATFSGDPGTGAFGPEPGNVTITAGGSVYGHYVLANGVGSITAGQDAGTPASDPSQPNRDLALSLIKGQWNVNAPNGSICLQEVRNPNGVFDSLGGTGSVGLNLFDYDPQAAVDLNAGVKVVLAGDSLPRLSGYPIPVILPPTLSISAGSGGVVLETSVTLFPSAYGDLNITTTAGGSLVGASAGAQLVMSDSSQTQWTSAATFGTTDHGSIPRELLPTPLLNTPNNSGNPVEINISGNMENLTISTTKQTRITVGGDMIGCSFSGENLNASDVTSVNVAGQIYNQGSFSWVFLPNGVQSLPAADAPPNSPWNWLSVLYAAVDPVAIASLQVPANLAPSQYAALAAQDHLFPNGSLDQTLFYNPTTGRLTFNGSMSANLQDILEQPLTVLRYGANGYPVVVNGTFVTDTVTWADASKITALYQASQGAPSLGDSSSGYRIGGPGEFDIHAGSISLGNSLGILSYGVGDRYANLASVTPAGAAINVTVDGNLEMFASTIAALGGGNVNVTSTGGTMDLGSQELVDVIGQVIKSHGLALGIYTSGRGGVNVTALDDINIDTSRIAALNGGSVNVESLQGSVNAGSGGTLAVPVYAYYVNPATGQSAYYAEQVYASGIVATTLVNPGQVPGSPNVPGNITVLTPRGDIIASQGGILQEALNGNVSGGPTVTLTAGTRPTGSSPGYAGNIDLGDSGVIGGTVNLDANGSITGLVISRQNSTINAAGNFNGTALSGGLIGLSAGGTVSGILIGVGGISASGGQGVTASLVGQNVSVGGGQAQSTLGTAAPTATSQSAAAQASSDTKEQLASNTAVAADDDKKKKAKAPVLTRRTGRVTVILPPHS
jgi:filamentous hemagglutinin family protein